MIHHRGHVAWRCSWRNALLHHGGRNMRQQLCDRRRRGWHSRYPMGWYCSWNAMAILLSKKVLLNSSFLPTTTKVGCSVPLLKSAKVAALNNQASKQFSMMTLGAHVAIRASSCCTSGATHWSSNFARKGPVVRSEVQHSVASTWGQGQWSSFVVWGQLLVYLPKSLCSNKY